MNCVICKTGRTHPGDTTVTLHRGKTIVVIRDVPADICEDCGEYYLDEHTADRVYRAAESCAQRNVELEVQSYAA
jgi:YgiT-type zinc finger domain-containing protein